MFIAEKSELSDLKYLDWDWDYDDNPMSKEEEAKGVVVGYTTKAFGYALVDECERIQRELDRGKKIDDILNGK